jgi:hypothetical protein
MICTAAMASSSLRPCLDKHTGTATAAEVPDLSRVGAVALYTVLWTVVAKYRKWPFSAPHRTKTPQPINTKFEQLIASARPRSRSNFIMIGWWVSAPHIGEIYGRRSFFPHGIRLGTRFPVNSVSGNAIPLHN